MHVQTHNDNDNDNDNNNDNDNRLSVGSLVRPQAATIVAINFCEKLSRISPSFVQSAESIPFAIIQ